ncbi:PREDICTED: putative pentatricopeptide repeat-containing protein At1g28020 [Camelina sativa]|uniref:Pentatricopeptide repeat-containing protein At1g28020 n=1 Tax=Camelina sativa TaxID=90675 RepID=A0ABM1QZJ6_CAMSA|nr:PREDICTED: putative pentatricopeptide repeat-containing protein At1g28020 [Camelina sativa]
MIMTHNLQQHARRILAYSSRSRFFCSYTNGTLPSPATNQTLLSRIEAADANRKAEITTRYSQALEVSEWMTKQKICNLVPEDFTTRFHLIENVLGLGEAEKFLESIPENLRGESMYTSLLRNYSRQPGLRALCKAVSTFEKMEKLGSRGNRDKVHEILQKMKDNNVEFDNVTVNNALRVYAAVSDVETMDKFLADWSAITTLDGLTPGNNRS